VVAGRKREGESNHSVLPIIKDLNVAFGWGWFDVPETGAIGVSTARDQQRRKEEACVGVRGSKIEWR